LVFNFFLFIISPCFNLLFPRLRVILCKQYLGHVTTKYTWIIVYAKGNFIFCYLLLYYITRPRVLVLNHQQFNTTLFSIIDKLFLSSELVSDTK
jgi:hypothetical protein